MTASSALPPCRVPAIAPSRYELNRLSGAATTTSTTTNNNSNTSIEHATVLTTTVRRRPVLPPKSVCRSLFGPPDPAETQKMLQEEDERIKREFREKYNFEVDALSEVSRNLLTSEKINNYTRCNAPSEEEPLKPTRRTVVNVSAPPALPKLIEAEMREHEQKKCNSRLIVQQPTTTTTTPSDDSRVTSSTPRNQQLQQSGSGNVSGANKRNKQMLMTESFKIRKTMPHVDLAPSATGRVSSSSSSN